MSGYIFGDLEMTYSYTTFNFLEHFYVGIYLINNVGLVSSI